MQAWLKGRLRSVVRACDGEAQADQPAMDERCKDRVFPAASSVMGVRREGRGANDGVLSFAIGCTARRFHCSGSQCTVAWQGDVDQACEAAHSLAARVDNAFAQRCGRHLAFGAPCGA